MFEITCFDKIGMILQIGSEDLIKPQNNTEMDMIFEIPELSCKHIFVQFWNIVQTHAEYTFFKTCVRKK